MLVLANIVSIVCFFLMDLFTVEVETQASIGCSIVSSTAELSGHLNPQFVDCHRTWLSQLDRLSYIVSF